MFLSLYPDNKLKGVRIELEEQNSVFYSKVYFPCTYLMIYPFKFHTQNIKFASKENIISL